MRKLPIQVPKTKDITAIKIDNGNITLLGQCLNEKSPQHGVFVQVLFVQVLVKANYPMIKIFFQGYCKIFFLLYCKYNLKRRHTQPVCEGQSGKPQTVRWISVWSCFFMKGSGTLSPCARGVPGRRMQARPRAVM